MKKILTILFVILFISPLSIGYAQKTYSGVFKFINMQSSRQDNELHLSFDLDVTSVHMPGQLMLELTPVLRLSDNSQSYYFDPIIILGKTRNKVLQRELMFNNYTFDKQPQQCICRQNGKRQFLPITLSVPYVEWMRNAELVLIEKTTGCAECDMGNKEYQVADRVLPVLFSPSYALQYVMPDAEPVKQRSETYAAHLNYKVGKYELLRDFENNAQVLNEVDKIVSEIRNDGNLTIQTLTITGYASPEGNYNRNMELSKNRAYSFVNYLVKSHNLSESIMKTDWKGEDWEGLRKNITSSGLSDRDAIIRLIDENQDIARRKERLHALNGGATYRMLLRDYYPPLRRNEYTIAYVARPFDIEEARDVMKTKPHHLSLNEMFLVANTYPKGSVEFKDVFDVAVRLYPEDEVANLNAAAQEIESGAIDRAIRRLQKINRPEALNNLGIAYAKNGEYIEAAACFKKAAEAGNSVARSNGEQLDKFLDN